MLLVLVLGEVLVLNDSTSGPPEREGRMGRGTVDKMTGRMKETTGMLAGDTELEQEGNADALVGTLNDATVEVVVTTKRKGRGAPTTAARGRAPRGTVRGPTHGLPRA